MPATLKLLFEVGNLDNASPATVSRMGMVYMGPNALGWEPVVEAWVKTLADTSPDLDHVTRPADDAEGLRKLFLANVGPYLEFLNGQCEKKMQIFDVCLVSTSLKLLDGLLPYKSQKPEPFGKTLL